jgi:hypothetical protein
MNCRFKLPENPGFALLFRRGRLAYYPKALGNDG